MIRKKSLSLSLLFLVSLSAEAQFRDIIKKADPNKIRKGVNVARSATKEFSLEEEVEIGRVVAARVLATYPLSKDESLQKYVTLVGNTLAAYSSRPELDWHFAVIETPMINAFCTPGGFIFVTTGALEQMASEAELAAVLGHEIAHATEKHILKEIKRANLVEAGKEIADSAHRGTWLTENLARRVGDISNERLFKTGVGRREELESDRIGAELAAAAGYRSDAMVSFLTRLEALEGEKSSRLSQLTSTHPRAAVRIKALSSKVNATGAELAERLASWRSAQ